MQQEKESFMQGLKRTRKYESKMSMIETNLVSTMDQITDHRNYKWSRKDIAK